MPLRLNVGLSKKIGLPDYGSLGASCHVELELDGSLLQSDPELLQQRARDVFAACREAVQEELTRNQMGSTATSGTQPQSNGSGSPAGNGSAGNGNGNGHARSHGRKATLSQARAISAIADRQGIALTDLLRSRFGVEQPADLTITEASQLIDELKATANGAGGRR